MMLLEDMRVQMQAMLICVIVGLDLADSRWGSKPLGEFSSVVHDHVLNEGEGSQVPVDDSGVVWDDGGKDHAGSALVRRKVARRATGKCRRMLVVSARTFCRHVICQGGWACWCVVSHELSKMGQGCHTLGGLLSQSLVIGRGLYVVLRGRLGGGGRASGCVAMSCRGGVVAG